jgi:hypothetical protein
MKKTLLIIFVLSLTNFSFAQLNPITNLQWDHWYEYPMNCFTLSWSPPNSSANDTLIGYNIYQESDLYEFTTIVNYSCNPCFYEPYNYFCEFITYNGGSGFTFTIKAVYNSTQEESIGVSDHCMGIALNIENIDSNNKISIFPNPTTGKIRVQAEDIESIEVFDITGKHLTGFENLSCLKELDLSTQPKGMYIIKVRTSKGVVVRKVVLE